MSEHDVPAERGRDELRERLADAAKFLRRCRGTEPVEFFEEHATACEEAAALLGQQEARADDPETDGTDFAHPAYFRGKRDGIRGAVDALERVLDHGRRGGTFGDERLQAFAARLDSLRAVAQDAPPPPPILSRKHANEIAYFLRRPDMAHDAKRERLASLVERAGAVTCPCGDGPGHGDAWCGDYECPTCGRGPELDEAIFQAGVERGRADMAPAENES